MPQLIDLSGTCFEMGLQHGRLLRENIQRLSRDRLMMAGKFAREHGASPSREECLALARKHLPIHEQYSPDVIAEWKGIAEGAEVPLEEVFFANALTDFQDVLWQYEDAEVHGCTSFAISATASASDHVVIGQTWDMHASAEEHIVMFRRDPLNGARSLTMTTAGCLTLTGVNEHGIAVGNNNLRPIDAKPGVIYLAMLHRALAQSNWEDAKRAITEAPRASGHNYIMAHEGGAWVDIETTATAHAELHDDVAGYVHTNHYLDPDLAQLEEPQLDTASSRHRLGRLRELFASTSERYSPERLQRLLSDHEGGDLAICRHGEGHDTRSCAFVVSDPVSRSMWVALGPPCRGQLERFSLAGEAVN